MSQEEPRRNNSLMGTLKTRQGVIVLTITLAILLSSIMYIFPSKKIKDFEKTRKEHIKKEKEVVFTSSSKLRSKKNDTLKISKPMEELAAGLAEKLKKNPEDVAGWTLLGKSYGLIGKHNKAVEALEKAIALSPNDSDLLAIYGEALVTASSGTVDEKSKKIFIDVIKLNPDQPVAKLNLALLDFQEGKIKKAYNTWHKLAKEAPPKVSYLKSLQSKLNLAAEKLGIEAPSVLPITSTQSVKPNLPSALTIKDVNPGSIMSSEDQSVFIQSMVQRLADKMKENPGDLEGWMKLGKSYAVLGENKNALNSYRQALKLSPEDKSIQELIENLK